MQENQQNIKVRVAGKIIQLYAGGTYISYTKNKTLPLKKIAHLKQYVSQHYFWPSYHCCSQPWVKFYQLKIVDIDEERFIGCFENLKDYVGKRLYVIKQTDLSKEEWVKLRKNWENKQIEKK